MSSPRITRTATAALCGLGLLAAIAGEAALDVAATAQAAARGASGLPLPRYVSLKSKRVNMRVGPGTEYQVEWLYLKQGLPMEVIQEFDNWRKVRDPEGNEGWILHSLLSGQRMVIVAPWSKGKDADTFEMHDSPTSNSPLVARVEPGVIATVTACDGGWCQLNAGEASGFMRQSQLWGVYPDEKL
ncbi:MAG: SH3 domain-containing protein [Pseudomonadota bacterium]|nr:SH3 domain-containing protein [Pseudomonadota bacterium]